MDKFRDVVFNNKSFNKFGLYLTKDVLFDVFPESEFEFAEIENPINGDIIIDRKPFKNVDKVYVFKTFPNKIAFKNEKHFVTLLRNFLNTSRNDYYDLYDSNRKGYFCKAILKNISDFEKQYDGCYKISITFSCKPFWYSKLGQETIIKTGTNFSIELNNPEQFIAYPKLILSCSADGDSTSNGYTISFTHNGNNTLLVASHLKNTFTIDSENYYHSINNLRYLAGYEMPNLKPGITTISFSGTTGIDYALNIIPNWRCL